MTREQVNLTLRMMEQCRELSHEADSKREERRLIKEYGRMSRAIRPYLNGKPCSDEVAR